MQVTKKIFNFIFKKLLTFDLHGFIIKVQKQTGTQKEVATMLNKIAFIYTESKNQNDLFTPHHTRFDCAIKYGTNCDPYKFTYQCNTDYNMPNIKDIMYSLMLDAQTYEEYDNAYDMACDLGYDYYEEKEKVEKIWNSCKETCEALHEMFTQDELDDLAEELYD